MNVYVIGLIWWDLKSDFGSSERVKPDESFLLVGILLCLTSWESFTVLVWNPLSSIKVFDDDSLNESLVAAGVTSLFENHLGDFVNLTLWESSGDPEFLSKVLSSVMETGL